MKGYGGGNFHIATTYLLFSSGERLSYSWQEPVQGILSPLPWIKIFSCPMLTRRLLRPLREGLHKHFWFIFCFKHLPCDSLRGATSCSVPDAIKKVAFDSNLTPFRCVSSQQILLAPCALVGNRITEWSLCVANFLHQQQTDVETGNSRCFSQHWQFNW